MQPDQPKRSSGGESESTTPSLAREPLAHDETERKILDVLDDLDRHHREGMLNVSVRDGRVLRLLTESIGAKHVVEIGTSNGYSGIWFCLALRTTGGTLTTFEMDTERAALAGRNFQRAGVEKLVMQIIGDAHEEVAKLNGSIDLLFLDADKPGYIDCLNQLLPQVRPGGLIVAHNMVNPPPDQRYIEAITTNPDLETVFLHMDADGLGVTLKKR